ncbi:hypothetical protein, partial [Clostridium botulinum]|uniref:hypothetical protein n=1 Tax=Clostridium botulinum TaxID=1491 RepID=UPI003AF52598
EYSIQIFYLNQFSVKVFCINELKLSSDSFKLFCILSFSLSTSVTKSTNWFWRLLGGTITSY